MMSRLSRAALALALIVLMTACGGTDEGSDGLEPSESDPLELPIGPSGSGTVVGTVTVDSAAGSVATDGAIWVTQPSQQTISRIDAGTLEVTDTLIVGHLPVAVASAGDSIWVLGISGTLTRVDRREPAVTETEQLGDGTVGGPQWEGVAATDDALWVSNADEEGTVLRLDPATAEVMDTIDVGSRPSSLAVAPDAIWVANTGDSTISRIDRQSHEVTETVDVSAVPLGIAVTDEDVWVASGDGTVSRISKASATVTDTTIVGSIANGIAAASDGGIWVTGFEEGTLIRLDADTGEIVGTVDVGGALASPVVSASSVWVSDVDGGRVVRVG